MLRIPKNYHVEIKLWRDNFLFKPFSGIFILFAFDQKSSYHKSLIDYVECEWSVVDEVQSTHDQVLVENRSPTKRFKLRRNIPASSTFYEETRFITNELSSRGQDAAGSAKDVHILG